MNNRLSNRLLPWQAPVQLVCGIASQLAPGADPTDAAGAYLGLSGSLEGNIDLVLSMYGEVTDCKPRLKQVEITEHPLTPNTHSLLQEPSNGPTS